MSVEVDREGGFIVLHRKIQKWSLWYFMTAEQRMVFVTLLLAANWKDSDVWVGSRRYTVKRGQLIHSESVIARQSGVGRQVVRTTLAKLISEGAITRTALPRTPREDSSKANPPDDGELTRAPHLITVVNYCKYQDVPDDDNQASTIDTTNVQPRGNQGVTLSEQGKQEEQVTTSSARKARKATDPRFGVLRQIWEAEFRAAKGADYRWSAADSVGLHRVIEVDPEDFRARAKRSLRIVGFLACGTVAKLTSGEVWNQLAGVAPGPKRVIENVSDWNEGQVQAWQNLVQRPSANGSESSASEGSEPTKTPSLKVAASPTTCPVLPLRT